MTSLEKHRILAICAFLVAALIISTTQVQAQDKNPGLMPASGTAVSVDSNLAFNEQTHPPLRLTPDKSEILNLDTEVKRVIIGNDVHLNILTDSAKRLILVPRAPGATHFTLLDRDGQIIMQRHAIVVSPKEKYVRIRQTCRGGDSCMPVQMYYCPDMCHEIAIIGEDGTAFSGSLASEGEDDDTVTLTDLLNASGEGGEGGDDGGDEE